jgi:CDP-glucose 4,6-dehydratase
VSRDFWSDRPVLVTGHTGFKGTWLCLWLARAGARITGLSDTVPDSPSMFDVVDAPSLLADDRRGDVRSIEDVRGALAASHASVVFHLAAQPLVRRSYLQPLETFAVNTGGTVNVLEAARAADHVEAAVVVTTDKVYENREWAWGYREAEPLGGADPYSASKAAAELMTHAYRRSFFSRPGAARIATARAGNVIGGGDWSEDRLIPDVLRAVADRRPVVLRHPDAVRPWQHVLAPVDGYVLLAQRLARGEECDPALNFGPDAEDARSVRSVVEAVMESFGDEATGWQATQGEQPHEAGTLRLDASLARQQLGWRPPWDAFEGIRRTVDWHRAHRAGEDMLAFTNRQIDDYQGDAGER